MKVTETAAVVTVKDALDAWKDEQWPRLYGLLSDRDKKSTTKKAFVEKRRRLAQFAKLADYKIVNVEGKSNDDMFVSMDLMMLESPDTSFYPTQGWRHKTVKTTWHIIRDTRNEWKLTFPQRQPTQ